MNAWRTLLACLCLLVAPAALAEAEATKILVTFADPGMSNAARAGPVRPGYSRRSGNYLVSIDVRRAAKQLESRFKLRPIDEWPISPLKVHCIVYAVAANTDVDELIARLRDQSPVESAQRVNTFDVLAKAAGTRPDSYADLQDNMDLLEVVEAHRWSRGRGSSVTIVDTGADAGHPDLRSRIVRQVDFVNDAAGRFEDDAHGTAVAGIIGASADNGIGIVGVAPSASLSVLKACWYVDRQAAAVCDSFTLAKALSYAVESPAQIINLSLAGPRDPLLARLIGRAISGGKIVIVAAPERPGNNRFPAAIEGVISVVASGHGTGSESHNIVHAPGDEILVPVPGGGFDYASGSSLAAAHVSGVAALLMARQPGLTQRDVSALLAASEAGPGDSVSACRALSSLLGEAGCGRSMQAADGAAGVNVRTPRKD